MIPGSPASMLPIPIFILALQPFLQLLAVGGEGQLVALGDGFGIYLGKGEAALDARHGGHHPAQSAVAGGVAGWEQPFVASDAGHHQHGADVGFGIVLHGWCPTADDVPHREVLAFRAEALVVALQDFPCRPIAVGHGLELDECAVGLSFAGALPTGGRAADIEGIVVSDSSGCLHILFCFLFYCFWG